jgi:hypothetical protein
MIKNKNVLILISRRIKMKNKLIISASGKATEVCVALKTLVETFGKDMTLAEIEHQVRLARFNDDIKKLFNDMENNI